MAGLEEPGIGEVYRLQVKTEAMIHRLDSKWDSKFAGAVSHETVTRLEASWSDRLAADRAAAVAEIGSLRSRISDLEGWNTWFIRAVVGLVIVGVVTMLLRTNGIS